MGSVIDTRHRYIIVLILMSYDQVRRFPSILQLKCRRKLGIDIDIQLRYD